MGMCKLKKLSKSTLIFLLFFLVFLFKDYFYFLIGILNPREDVLLETRYTILEAKNKDLMEELENILQVENLKYFEEYEYEVSKVLIRNTFTFNDFLVIENNDYEVGMAVVGPHGLIGRVSGVSKNTARVDLVTNPDNNISIMVHSSYGILSGYSKEYECLIIKNLNNYNNVGIGDLVYTSGLSTLPGGVIIGKVIKINYDRFKIEKNICVESRTDLSNIYYVGVIRK